MAPNIYHTPVYTAKTGANLVITATVTDNLAVSSVKLLYRISGENTCHTAMMNGLNSKFTAIIPAMYVTEKGLDYYLEATDGISTTRRGSASNPYHITITASQDVSGSGELVYLFFSVANDCPTGRYPLTLAVGEAYDTALAPMTVTARSGSL